MRWAALAFVAGCSFSSPAAPGAGIDAASVAAIDAPEVDGMNRPATTPACLSNPKYNQTFGTHLYKRTTDTPAFDDAVEECWADGAYLAHVDSPQENTFLAATFNTGWLGVSDQETENTFRSISDGTVAQYSDFQGQEPNDANGDEDCVYINSNESWNDTPCRDTRNAICECDPDFAAPTPPACRTMTGGQVKESRLYFPHGTALSWADARDACAGVGAYLAVPSDNAENNNIKDVAGVDEWIGASQDAAGTWSWVDNAPFGYMNFNGASPPALGSMCAIQRHSNAKWDGDNCDILHPYVCECPP